MTNETAKPRSILEQRKHNRELAVKKLKILLIIGIILIILVIIVIIAAVREGGFSNLLKGSSDPFTNTLKNIGTSFTGNDNNNATPTPDINKPIELPLPSEDPKQITLNRSQNFIVFSSSQSTYEITIKKNTFVEFKNVRGDSVTVRFSNGRTLRLKDLETENMYFADKGNYSFEDILDTTPLKVKGIVHVVE